MLSLIDNVNSTLIYIANSFSNAFYNLKHLPSVVSDAYTAISSVFSYVPEDLSLFFNFALVVVLLLKLVRW